MNASERIAHDALGDKAIALTWMWNNDEYVDDAMQRAVLVAALKLAFWRKHPTIYRMRLMRILSGAWFEAGALLAYERGKLFTDFRRDVLRKLPADHEIFV